MRKPPAPRLVSVAIFTTITVIFWVFFSVYNTLTKKPNVDVPPELLEPIDPSLDIKTLETLEGKLFYEEGATP